MKPNSMKKDVLIGLATLPIWILLVLPTIIFYAIFHGLAFLGRKWEEASEETEAENQKEYEWKEEEKTDTME